jgi:hypothetical protein
MLPVTTGVAVDSFRVQGVTPGVENVHYLEINLEMEVAVYMKTADEYGIQSEHNSKIKISEAIFLE